MLEPDSSTARVPGSGTDALDALHIVFTADPERLDELVGVVQEEIERLRTEPRRTSGCVRTATSARPSVPTDAPAL